MTATSGDALIRLWPLFGLRLATPRLVLRPVSDDDLPELVDLVVLGLHDPAAMPFATPWTDAPRDELIAATLRYHWQSRAASVPAAWSVHFAVRAKGVLLGTQEMSGTNFCVTRPWILAPGSAALTRVTGSELRCVLL